MSRIEPKQVAFIMFSTSAGFLLAAFTGWVNYDPTAITFIAGLMWLIIGRYWK